MKDLLTYIIDCGGACATPGNTMGAGNVAPPGENGKPGSGDVPTAKAKREKVHKKRKIKEEE